MITSSIEFKSEFFSLNECRFFVADLEDDVDDDANEISFNELLLLPRRCDFIFTYLFVYVDK